MQDRLSFKLFKYKHRGETFAKEKNTKKCLKSGLINKNCCVLLHWTTKEHLNHRKVVSLNNSLPICTKKKVWRCKSIFTWTLDDNFLFFPTVMGLYFLWRSWLCRVRSELLISHNSRKKVLARLGLQLHKAVCHLRRQGGVPRGV